MTENEVAKQIVDAAYRVHTSLGPGLLESVYEVVRAYELEKRGLTRCGSKRSRLSIRAPGSRWDSAQT